MELACAQYWSKGEGDKAPLGVKDRPPPAIGASDTKSSKVPPSSVKSNHNSIWLRLKFPLFWKKNKLNPSVTPAMFSCTIYLETHMCWEMAFNCTVKESNWVFESVTMAASGVGVPPLGNGTDWREKSRGVSILPNMHCCVLGGVADVSSYTASRSKAPQSSVESDTQGTLHCESGTRLTISIYESQTAKISTH